MPMHIFKVSMKNFLICAERNVVGVPSMGQPRSQSGGSGIGASQPTVSPTSQGSNSNTASNHQHRAWADISARLLAARTGDLVMFQTTAGLYGGWQVAANNGDPHYDIHRVSGWQFPTNLQEVFPFRLFIERSSSSTPWLPVVINNRSRVRHIGPCDFWSWSPSAFRPQTKTQELVASAEGARIINLATKADSISLQPLQPHVRLPGSEDLLNIVSQHFASGTTPLLEGWLQACFSYALAHNISLPQLGTYTDYIIFPNASGLHEIDILLIDDSSSPPTYTCVELKNKKPNKHDFASLADYHTWVLKNVAHGVANSVRSIMIAPAFPQLQTLTEYWPFADWPSGSTLECCHFQIQLPSATAPHQAQLQIALPQLQPQYHFQF